MKKFSILIIFLLATLSLAAQTIQDGVATFPDGTTEIPKQALKGNKEITKVIIPNTVTKIADEAFRGCENLAEIDIPLSVTSIGNKVFEDCTNLAEIKIPASVKSIGKETFKHSGITEIIIPPSVMSIGDKAFANCEKLTSVTVRRNSKPHRLLKEDPAKIDRIFQDPPELIDVDSLSPPSFPEREPMTTALGDKIEDGVLYIKEGTTKIPKKAYTENPFFQKIVIPSTVTKIEDQAFFACPNLIEIDIPSSVKNVGKGVFQDCFWVTKITLHEGLTNLDNKLFKHTGITELTIPSTVTSIGEEIFGCTPLTEVIIPPNVMTIGEKTFAESDLTAIRVTKDSKTHMILKDNPKLVVSGERIQPTQFTKKGTSTTEFGDTIENGVLYIKEGTTQIKNKAYSGNLDFQKVVIPATVTKIGNQAFSDCTNLVEVDIPSSVKSIEIEAFQNCIWLSKLTLNEGLTKLSSRSFKNTGIKNLRIPATVKEFYDYVFSGCIALTEIVIPSSVTKIGRGIFNDCKNLAAIRVDKYSEAHAYFSVDDRIAFTNARPTKTKEEWKETAKYSILEDGVLYIAKDLKKIPDGMYKSSKSIKKIRFSDTVEIIGEYAFQGNQELKKVVIPGNVKKLGQGAFLSCHNLEEVVCGDGVEKLELYAFYDCPKLTSVTLPKTVTRIVPDGLFWANKGSRIFHCYAGSYAFNMAKKCGYKIDIVGIDEEHADEITELNFSGNKVINAMNVYCPNLKSIKMGYFVEKIAAEAFRPYPIEKLNLSNTLVEIGKNAFNDKTIIRANQNTGGDKWAKSNGYYLCGVLGSINNWSKDKSKEIKVDFTRILCDDDPYWRWKSYKFSMKQPLKIEDVHGELVLTSFMLYPCKNVTVTDKDGKTLITNKTIQPLTRTVLKDFDFLTDSTDNYKVTTDDEFYKWITSFPLDWHIAFLNFYRWPVNNRPAHLRLWLAGMYNVAYVIASPIYEQRCYEAVENKTLVTDNALTKYLTKEEMEKLLKKTKKYHFYLGKCRDGWGLCGGATIYLDNAHINGLTKGSPDAFWHEFSHGMGWGEESGNMCNEGRPKPFNIDWPSIGSIVFQEEFKKGNCPYNEGESLLDPWFFAREYMNEANPEDNIIRDDVLYIGDRCPCTDSHQNKTNFTKVVIPSSVGFINGSAFKGTAIKELTIPSSVVVIDKEAFQKCSDLRSIDIPDNVRELGDASFQNCPQLNDAKIGKGLRQLNYRLFKGSGLREITIPKNIQWIGNETFQDCKNLRKVVIEEGVRKIGDNAFNNTALTEITIPNSVTMFGKNITSKNVVWNVKMGTAAYEYAKENKYKIKLPQEDMNKIATQILAECKNAVEVPADKWVTETFPAYDDRRKWDFSSSLKGSGEYYVTFSFTGGASALSLTDSLIAADGKVIAYFPETRTVGNNPKQIVYTFNVPNGAKKLEMFAFAKRDGGKASNGTVTVESTAEYAQRILAESANAEPVSSDGWENGVFTQNDTLRKWDFSEKINGINGGDYVFKFSYIDGSDTLRLTDSLFIADGKVIGHYPEMLSVGPSSREVSYNITIPKGTKKLEMFALARAGKSINSGTITILMEDDGTIEGITARILAENANPKSAPTDKWDKDTFTQKNVRRKWDFSSNINGGGDYVVSFTHTDGKQGLCLADSLFLADGKPLAHFSGNRSAGRESHNIVFRLNVPKGTKKLELYALAKKSGGGDTSGIVNVETMDSKAKKVLADGKKYKKGPFEWEKKTFGDEYDKCKWDITTLMMKDGEFSDTYMFGDYSVIFDSGEGMTLADVMIFADGKMILYAPDMRKLDGVTKAPYDITVPDGTKKLELYGLIRGSKAGKLTMEKGE